MFKVLLTATDTANAAFREKSFALPTPFTSTGNRLFCASVQFKPGYTYTLTEQVDVTANTFLFTSLEEMGASTLFNYQDCGFGSALCDYSASHILPQDVRYNMAGSWNGRFIPAMAYTAAYGFEHHLISFYVSDNTVTGVKELAANNGVALGQNIPNPFTSESTVNYQLAKDVTSAVFTVTDIMGRVITSEKANTAAGAHSIKLGAYAAGVYYYSLNVDGHVTTKKMIVE
ncbi:MAG: T9SS type A sorting domain-containing protein [Bacteroidetes bacterium]|nr:T9SS type A sorting domain-containing protein [Bacteroidota bacterium]